MLYKYSEIGNDLRFIIAKRTTRSNVFESIGFRARQTRVWNLAQPIGHLILGQLLKWDDNITDFLGLL